KEPRARHNAVAGRRQPWDRGNTKHRYQLTTSRSSATAIAHAGDAFTSGAPACCRKPDDQVLLYPWGTTEERDVVPWQCALCFRYDLARRTCCWRCGATTCSATRRCAKNWGRARG